VDVLRSRSARYSDGAAFNYALGASPCILDALGRGLLKEFPNPERSECPGLDVLKRVASRTMPLAEVEGWVDHVGSWRPGDGDFSGCVRVREAKRGRTLVAVAAGILVVIGTAGWVLIQQHNETVLSQAAVLDLRNRSASRSPEQNLGEPPLELRRRLSQLNLYLPTRSPEGAYEVRIVTTDGDTLLNIGGTARLDDGITSLQMTGKASVARHGQCTMQIRKPPAEWSSYPLVLR